LRTRLEYLNHQLERLYDYTIPEQSLNAEKQDDGPLGSITGLYALFTAPIVATTVDAFDRLPDLWFDLVVVEEASQLWLIKLLKVLTKVIRGRGAERLPPVLVLSGDPQQLPPFLETYESGAEYTDLSSKPLQVNVTKQVAEVQIPEKFETPFAMICRRHSERVTTLTAQHRMHSEIAMLVNSLFYSEQQWISSHEDQGDGVWWINTVSRRPQPERESGGTSRYNDTEIQIISQLVRGHLANHKDILVISPYLAQVRILDEKLPKRVRVRTIDGCQGIEAETVIISFVSFARHWSDVFRWSDAFNGFVVEPRRMNVAFSRARHSLYLVGNFDEIMRGVKDQVMAERYQHIDGLVHFFRRGGVLYHRERSDTRLGV
jgi:superfamily I DNA and/or RNA helicase